MSLGAADGAADGVDEGAVVGAVDGFDVAAAAILPLGWAVGCFELKALVQADGHSEVSCLDDGADIVESNSMNVGELEVRS
jgi:hypothetical protein